jgi:hypothetical protein
MRWCIDGGRRTEGLVDGLFRVPILMCFGVLEKCETMPLPCGSVDDRTTVHWYHPPVRYRSDTSINEQTDTAKYRQNVDLKSFSLASFNRLH